VPRLVVESSRPTVTFTNRACNELKVVISTQSKIKFLQTGCSRSSGVVWLSHSSDVHTRRCKDFISGPVGLTINDGIFIFMSVSDFLSHKRPSYNSDINSCNMTML
jgi:hypothetical protein